MNGWTKNWMRPWCISLLLLLHVWPSVQELRKVPEMGLLTREKKKGNAQPIISYHVPWRVSSVLMVSSLSLSTPRTREKIQLIHLSSKILLCALHHSHRLLLASGVLSAEPLFTGDKRRWCRKGWECTAVPLLAILLETLSHLRFVLLFLWRGIKKTCQLVSLSPSIPTPGLLPPIA